MNGVQREALQELVVEAFKYGRVLSLKQLRTFEEEKFLLALDQCVEVNADAECLNAPKKKGLEVSVNMVNLEPVKQTFGAIVEFFDAMKEITDAIDIDIDL